MAVVSVCRVLYFICMTITLDAATERLLAKQVAAGIFATVAEAAEAAVQFAYNTKATPCLEALLDEALSHQGRRVPLEELRRNAG